MKAMNILKSSIIFVIFSSYIVLCCTKQTINNAIRDDNKQDDAFPNSYKAYVTIEEQHTIEKFQIANEWKYLDFEYTTYQERQRALKNRKFIPGNAVPLGIDIYDKRLFITTPRWKDGVPASIGTVPYPSFEISPVIKPYPHWEAQGDPYNPDCTKLISVYRTFVDVCKRLWMVDSGIVNPTVAINQICPPKIVVYDLRTDKLLINYNLPMTQIKEDSLHSNIIVDVQHTDCDNAYAYITDVWRFGIVVYYLKSNRSWRITNYNFYPNPKASNFHLYGLNFKWLDGVFGMSLSAIDPNIKERFLYFHPMASYKEFMVSTSILRNESLWSSSATDVSNHFIEVGDRGEFMQSSTSGISNNGVMFYTLVHMDNVACWDTTKPYKRINLHPLLPISNNLLHFPNDLKVSHSGPDQELWIMSNRLPIYLYSQLDHNNINFRILHANVKSLVSGTICDPSVPARTAINIKMIEEGKCN